MTIVAPLGLRSPRSFVTASALVESPHRIRCFPQSHRSPGRDAGFSGIGGTALASSSSGMARSHRFLGDQRCDAKHEEDEGEEASFHRCPL